jgi:hypothetical protein
VYEILGNHQWQSERTGWSWDCVAAVDSQARTMFTVDAHRDETHFVVRADQKLAAFVELESAIRVFSWHVRGGRERGPFFRG